MDKMMRNQTCGIHSACNDRRENRCGCGSCGNHDVEQKLRRINFALYETILYLDAYPDCKKALNYYNKLICERDGLRSALSEKCKRPMSAFENKGADSWDWISSPWPWEASAN